MAAIYALANGTIQQFFSTWAVEQAALINSWPLPSPAPVGPGSYSGGAGQFVLAATLESTVAALWAGTATTAQTQKAIAFLAVKLRIAGII